MKAAYIAAAVVLLASASSAAAKTCKEPLTASSRSSIQGTEAARTKRATDNAEKKWSKDAKAKYGFAYQLWLRADAKKVECRQTPKSSICTVTATPCRLI